MRLRLAALYTSIAGFRRAAALVALCGLLIIGLLLYWWLSSAPAYSTLIGESREGVLHSSDPIRREMPRGRENSWTFHAREGQQITIIAESWEFDVYLLLLDSDGKKIAWADNNRTFFNAQISATIPASNEYTVVVCSANADQQGAYSLTLQEGTAQMDWSEAAAKDYYLRGVEWAERTGSRLAMSWLNLGIGKYYRERCQWDQAQKHFDESIPTNPGAETAYLRWSVAMERGRMFARRSSYDQASAEFQSALQISATLLSAREAEGLTHVEIGKLYSSTARADLAKVHFRTARQDAEADSTAAVMLDLYSLKSEAERIQDAQNQGGDAERSYRFCAALDPALELQAMHVLAGTYLFVSPGRAHEGLELARQMRLRARETGCVDEEVAALTLMSMGHYAARNIDSMIDSALEALSLTSPTDENPNTRRIALQLLGDGEIERRNNQAALNWCLKALEEVERAWAKQAIAEVRHELLSQSRAICTQILKNLYALNAQRPDSRYARQAFDYAERSRSRSLLEEVLQEKTKGDQITSRDRELLQDLSAVRGQLALLRASGQGSREELYRLQEKRAELIAQQIQLQAEIQNTAGNSYRTIHMSPLTTEEGQANLARFYPNSAVLYYQLGIQESFLITMTQDSCSLHKLPGSQTISAAIAEWRNEISSQDTSAESSGRDLRGYERLARRLYELLVKPAEKAIRGRDLIIVPSDVLTSLAFEALIVSEAGHGARSRPRYLVDDHAIAYTPSLSVMIGIENRRQTAPAASNMLLIGDAVAEAARTESELKARSSDHGLQGLPAARQEIMEIANIARASGIAVTALVGEQATEARLRKTDLSSLRFLHLATHGISDTQDGEASALTLFPDPQGEQDGILTSDETSKMKLQAELVVLSGCETSSGQISGAEGVVGLNRAFLIAGASCVCGSLWPVDDKWTKQFMTAFYSRLLTKSSSKLHALRLAKLDFIKRGATPSQWAPFILTGSPR